MDGLAANQTPIDFFDEKHLNFGMTRNVNFLVITLEPGDCLYVPAYFYVQSKTLGAEKNLGDTLMVTHKYESHSRMVDMVFDGIENMQWISETNDKEDKVLTNYLDY